MRDSKLVKENISFDRGYNPKEILRLGEIVPKIKILERWKEEGLEFMLMNYYTDRMKNDYILCGIISINVNQIFFDGNFNGDSGMGFENIYMQGKFLLNNIKSINDEYGYEKIILKKPVEKAYVS